VNHLAKLATRGAAAVTAVRPRFPSLFEATPGAAAPPPESAPLAQPAAAGPDVSRRIIEVEEVLRREARIASEPHPAANVPPPMVVPAAPPPAHVERVERIERFETERPRAAKTVPPQSIVREKTTERVERTETRIVTPPAERTEVLRERDTHHVVEAKSAPAAPHVLREREPLARGDVPIARPAFLAAPMSRREPVRDAAPTIHVTIGRVDVRAVMPQAPAQRTESAPRPPALSLEDYLAQRNRETR
jgi:hypothetical protein